MKTILFISHEATRTGAPILLLRLIEKIKSLGDFEILILLKNGGELKEEFEKFGQTFIWNSQLKEDTFFQILKSIAYKKVGIPTLSRKEKYKLELIKSVKNADIIFNNTVTNAALLKKLSLDGKKVFSYFHELQVITEASASLEDIKYLEKISDKILVPSLAVKEYLTKNFDIPEIKIIPLKYIIPRPKIGKTAEGSIKKANKTFLVGFGGTMHWRKGYEFLPLLAKYIIIDNKTTDIQFVWIGVNKSSLEFIILKNDLIKLDLFQYFTFLEPEKNIEASLSQLDLFVLPSREDAFPLIVLEAAFYEVPCVYFLKAGGIEEFLGDDAGMGVDYLNVDMMGQKIIELKANEKLRLSLGKRAKEKIIEYSTDDKIMADLLPYFTYFKS